MLRVIIKAFLALQKTIKIYSQIALGNGKTSLSVGQNQVLFTEKANCHKTIINFCYLCVLLYRCYCLKQHYWG